MKRILLLTDYRKSFYSTTTTQRTLCTMDVQRIARQLGQAGHDLSIDQFSTVDLNDDFTDVHVLYTSSEDTQLLYKSYIEDVILALEVAGARPIPSYKYLRAHHNKSMMEALRYQLFPEQARRLATRCFGTYEELVAAELGNDWPKVIKSAYGAGSQLVAKAENLEELLRTAKRISRAPSAVDTVREFRSRWLWKGYEKRSLHRNKFIVQKMITNLDGDFKVLRYGERYYTLYRLNRPGDFRASGGGILRIETPNTVDETALLNFARQAAEKIGTPIASLDIAFDGTEFHLIEFQCLNFGSWAAEKSTHHHVFVDGQWQKVVAACDLEAVFCDAIIHHLQDSRLRMTS